MKKHVHKAAQAQGTCPHEFSRKRYRIKECNTKPCLEEKDKDKAMTCNSKRDVVLLIDGSASLRTSGWAATKEAAAAVVNAMGPNVSVATILFSGPKTKKNYFKCSGQKFPNRKTGQLLGRPDMAVDCLVSWVNHFETDKAAVATKIQGMSWPRGSTLTYEALSMAETELNSGRRDAQAVVVVITDGKPMKKRKVKTVVGRLRRKARLMWVAVDKMAPVGLIKQWASVPWSENALFVKSFNELKSKKTVNRLVSNMCPDFTAA